MRGRKIAIALAALVVVAAAALVLVLPRRVPGPVRLLPEAEAVVYIDLRLLRRAGVLEGMPEVVREPEYEEFVRATGFQFERDLEQAAFAVHLPGYGGRSQEAPTRYSEIFVGRFDREAAAGYFRRIAKQVETQDGVEVFHIPVEERTVRVAILARDMVAVSNADDEVPMQQMIGNHRGRVPLRGPELVHEHFRNIPRASLAWAMSRALPDGRGGARFPLPGGFEVALPAGSVLLGSVRYVGEVQVRAEAVTPDEAEARSLANNMNAYLAIFRALGGEVQVADRDVTGFLESIEVRQDGERAVVTARMSHGFLRKMAEAPVEEHEEEE